MPDDRSTTGRSVVTTAAPTSARTVSTRSAITPRDNGRSVDLVNPPGAGTPPAPPTGLLNGSITPASTGYVPPWVYNQNASVGTGTGAVSGDSSSSGASSGSTGVLGSNDPLATLGDVFSKMFGGYESPNPSGAETQYSVIPQQLSGGSNKNALLMVLVIAAAGVGIWYFYFR